MLPTLAGRDDGVIPDEVLPSPTPTTIPWPVCTPTPRRPTPTISSAFPNRDSAPLPTIVSLPHRSRGYDLGQASDPVSWQAVAVDLSDTMLPTVAWIEANVISDDHPDGSVWAAYDPGTGDRYHTIKVASGVNHYGGGVAVLADDRHHRIHVWYGDGAIHSVAYIRERILDRRTGALSEPVVVAEGSIQQLARDEADVWYALRIGPRSHNGSVWLGRALPPSSDQPRQWSWEAVPGLIHPAYVAAMDVTRIAGRTLVVVAAVASQEYNGALVVASRWLESSEPWRTTALRDATLNQTGEHRPVARILPTAPQPLIAVAWSQYGRNTIGVVVSRNGGQSFDPPGILSSYGSDARVFAEYPSLAYRSSDHHLVATWTEREDADTWIDPRQTRIAAIPVQLRDPWDARCGSWKGAICFYPAPAIDNRFQPSVSARVWNNPRSDQIAIVSIDNRNGVVRLRLEVSTSGALYASPHS